MPQMTLELETLTPLLMNGAGRPEIRAASFRGAFRYWLRTILGGKSTTLSVVREGETKVFGDTERGSAVVIRVLRHDLEAVGDLHVLPTSARGADLAFTGYEDGQGFKLNLKTHPLAPDYPEDFLGAVLLALCLGGFGRRARRGGGNLRIVGFKGTVPDVVAGLLTALEAPDVRPSRALQDVLNYAVGAAGSLYAPHEIPRFPIIDQLNCVVLMGRGQPDPEKSLHELWQASGGYHHKPIQIRMKNANDKSAAPQMKEVDRWWAWGYAGASLRTPAPKSERWRPAQSPYTNSGRRASSVWMRLHFHQGNYFPLVTLFRAEPDHDSAHPGQPTSWQMLADFADALVKTHGYVKLFGDWSHW